MRSNGREAFIPQHHMTSSHSGRSIFFIIVGIRGSGDSLGGKRHVELGLRLGILEHGGRIALLRADLEQLHHHLVLLRRPVLKWAGIKCAKRLNGAHQARDLDGRLGCRLDESVDGAQAVVLVVGRLDLEGQARLSPVDQLVGGHSSGGWELRGARLDAGHLPSAACGGDFGCCWRSRVAPEGLQSGERLVADDS